MTPPNAPGRVGRAGEGGEALEGSPDQDDDRARLPACCDHIGEGVKFVALHLATDRGVTFHEAMTSFPARSPVNRERGNRDEQDHQRDLREESVEGERSGPLCPVNPRMSFLTAGQTVAQTGRTYGQACLPRLFRCAFKLSGTVAALGSG
jgi:hypothetical protein